MLYWLTVVFKQMRLLLQCLVWFTQSPLRDACLGEVGLRNNAVLQVFVGI